MPVVNLSGQAVDEAVSIEVAEKFIKQFNFIESGRDADGNITSAGIRRQEIYSLLNVVIQISNSHSAKPSGCMR